MANTCTLLFSFQGHDLDIQYIRREKHELEGVGVTLWPACLALSTFLVHQYGSTFFYNIRTLELGSGAGLLGLALAKAGANVTFSDASHAPGVLDLLRGNVQRNLHLSGTECERIVRTLNWGEPLPECIVPPYELVVAADVVYHKESIPLLIASLDAVTAHHSLVFVAFQEHSLDAMEAFCELAPKYFDCIDHAPSAGKAVLGDHYRPDLHIVELRKRRPGQPKRSFHVEFVRLAGLFDDADPVSSLGAEF